MSSTKPIYVTIDKKDYTIDEICKRGRAQLLAKRKKQNEKKL